MERDSTHFIGRTLAFHGILLICVLSLVSAASFEIYFSSREDALNQAKSRQSILADQTCREIDAYYTSIIRALGWIQSRQEFTISPATAAESRTADVTRQLEFGARPVAAQLIAEQLGDRVAAVFIYDQRSGVVTPIAPEDSTLTAAELPPDAQAWLKHVEHTQVSGFFRLNGQQVGLVAAPFTTVSFPRRFSATRPTQRLLTRPTTRPPRLLVAVVPGKQVEATFDPLIKEQDRATAMLVDNSLQVLLSSDRALANIKLTDFDSDELREMIQRYHDHPKNQTVIISQPMSAGSETMGPRIVTLAPVTVAQDQWTLFFAYPLADVDSSIYDLFKQAVFWAVVAAISVTGIVVSTTIRMIRYRARLERMKHQVLQRELSQARRVQEQWLPSPANAPPQMDLAAINQPASHISGDFYNWFELPDERETLVIGDVTGHGMAAAFLMATTQLLVRSSMCRLGDPGLAMWEVNSQLCSQMFVGQFVTMVIMTFDLKEMRIEAASAGHFPPLISSKDGQMRPMAMEAQIVLGVEKKAHYPTQRFALPELSSLLLYTDGVVEARGPGDERFGAQRLAESLKGHLNGAKEMIGAVTGSVREFVGERQPEDDLTLVAIQLRKVRSSHRRPAAITAAAGS